jgi:hypothetical protein
LQVSAGIRHGFTVPHAHAYAFDKVTHWRAAGWISVLAAAVGLVPLTVSGDPTHASTVAVGATTNWWSLEPLQRPPIPPNSEASAHARNPIDAFVAAKLAEKGLRPAPEADRRTLIRRLYFDLVGLPPQPEEIESFVSDPDPGAYEHLVDRLLASPQYGERWARHWLDVVHYGETHGYDKDQPRPNAWPYRDYVIRSLNEDKPYGRFVQEQVAGDALFPDTRDGIEALGFLAAGPWDLIGHAEVPESKIDGLVARHLDRDDMVVNTIQTFNSLTIQCAQCHNHKFDPISQEDYYSLQAVFAAIDRADQKYDIDPEVGHRRKAALQRQAELTARQQELNASILKRAGQPVSDLDRQIKELSSKEKQGLAYGYHSGIEKEPNSVKWVQIDLGQPRELASIVLHPCKDDFNQIGEGFGFPVRFKVELSDDPEFKTGVFLAGDFTRQDVRNPRLQPQRADATGRTARHIRVTATQLAPRQNDYIFALAELEAFDSAGTNLARGAVVTALDSTESPVRWQKSNLTDGWFPGLGGVDSTHLAVMRQKRDELVDQATLETERAELKQLEQQLVNLKSDLAQLPTQHEAYVAAVYRGSGAFSGTGASGGKPRVIRVLNRGNVQKPSVQVGPGALSCLSDLPARFKIGEGKSEAQRRVALAGWLSDPRNPLTWRSIVNRVWLYHFGHGLVDTPNDFGRMGAQPSHPGLLDWLAVEFRDGGQSLKTLHRLIVTSSTYRQSCVGDAAFARMDSDNRFLWRMNRRKLEAEELRDAMLQVSAKLDLTMGGPSFRDFVIEKPEHSPHYEYGLHDPNDPKCYRRSIYRFIVRSQPQPFLTTLDCPDPSMQVGKRNESVSPLQALALLNNGFVLAMANAFAVHVEQSSGDMRAQVEAAYYQALGHPPSADDSKALATYAREFGLANCCRLLFNLNEFAFVD